MSERLWNRSSSKRWVMLPEGVSKRAYEQLSGEMPIHAAITQLAVPPCVTTI